MLDKSPHLAGIGDLRHHHLQNIVHAAVVNSPHRRADEIITFYGLQVSNKTYRAHGPKHAENSRI